MKALVFHGPAQAEVSDHEPPSLGTNDVLVKLRRVGICHSDFDLLAGNYILPISYPVIPGHEWTGEVAEVGTAVTRFAVGDRVVGECSVADDEHFGFTVNGAIAEYFKAPAAWLHHLPDTCDDTVGALVEPFTVAYGATSAFDASDTVAVLGAGPIGLCATASLAAKGTRVVIVEPDSARRDLATHLGAQHGVDPNEFDATEQIMARTAGRGVEGVVEASGNPGAMASALTMAGYGGRINNVGINVGQEHPTKLGLIVEKALTIRGHVGSVGVWPAALRFLERTELDLSVIVSQRFALHDALKAFDAAEDRKNNIKIHIVNG